MIQKFRCFDKDTKTMHEVVAIDFKDWRVYYEAYGLRSYWNKNVVLMQSTGLRDKNGVEILEGDIVKFQDELHPIEFNKYKFEADGFWRNWQDDPGDFFSEGAYKEYEVIGNVCENRELLDCE